MEVLKKNRDFLSSSVSVEVLVGELVERRIVSSFEGGVIVGMGCFDMDAFDANDKMYGRLLDCLENRKDEGESIYTVFEIIRSRYANIAIHIPDIQLDIRYKSAIGPDVMLTVCRMGSEIGFDLRKMKVCIWLSSLQTARGLNQCNIYINI